MIRKLHNSLLALSATTLALAACLVVTGSGMGGADHPAPSTIAGAALPPLPQVRTQTRDATAKAGTDVAVRAAAGPRKGKSRRNRQTLAMPFFSFATRS